MWLSDILPVKKCGSQEEQLNINTYEQQLLNQRGIIETIFNCLKHKYHIWHTRHRSVLNAMSHLIAALAAYTIEPLKLSAVKLLTKEPALLTAN